MKDIIFAILAVLALSGPAHATEVMVYSRTATATGPYHMEWEYSGMHFYSDDLVTPNQGEYYSRSTFDKSVADFLEQSCKGVVTAYVGDNGYTVFMRKAELFDWKEIHPCMLEAIE